MHHVMLDLETWGVRPGCAIRSIGAVEFEVDGRTGDSFYANIEQRSCEVVGLTIDPATRDWWYQQPGDVQALLKKDPQPLRAVALDFWKWFRGCGGSGVRVWSHGAPFDTVIWQAAAEACGQAIPWSHWNVRDTRTLYDLVVFDIRDIERDGKAHSAKDDCYYQIKCVAAAYQKFNHMEKQPVVVPATPAEVDVFG